MAVQVHCMDYVYCMHVSRQKLILSWKVSVPTIDGNEDSIAYVTVNLSTKCLINLAIFLKA